MGHRTSRQNHYPEGSEEQKEEIIPPILTDFDSFGVLTLRDQMRIPVACNEENP